jgi:hypothetical protein
LIRAIALPFITFRHIEDAIIHWTTEASIAIFFSNAFFWQMGEPKSAFSVAKLVEQGPVLFAKVTRAERNAITPGVRPSARHLALATGVWSL